MSRVLSTDLGLNAANFGSLGRGGAALAVTSGLVATLTLPASAAPVSIVSGSTSHAGGQQSRLTVPAAVLTGAPVEAPTEADIAFDHASFKPAKVLDSRPQVRASRSAVRTPVAQAPATKPAAKTVAVKNLPFGSLKGASVLAVAARYVGVPYRFGGTTPAGFDCSGYVGYVYRLLGVNLPRTAQAQMNAATIIPRSAAKAGDLVFMLSSSGHAYHVGIYAGGGTFYDAGSTGGHISHRAIFSSNVAFGRV